MNKTIGIQLVVYSLLLASLSYLVHHLAPALALPTLITGLAGGGFCLVWGFLAVAGSQGKALPLLTLLPVNFVMLSQTVVSWSGGNQEVAGRRPAAAVITVLLALSIAMLMRIAYAGMEFDGQARDPSKDGATKPQATGKAAAPATTGRRP
jgi:hypothetical protein